MTPPPPPPHTSHTHPRYSYRSSGEGRGEGGGHIGNIGGEETGRNGCIDWFEAPCRHLRVTGLICFFVCWARGGACAIVGGTIFELENSCF